MSVFTKHTPATAPAAAARVLERVERHYGFVPNLAAYLAEAPVVLDAVMDLSGRFDRTTFDPLERQIVLLTVSVANRCDYCVTAHTGMARQAGMDDATLSALLARTPLPDPRHEALRRFVAALVEQRGWIDEEAVQAFLAAGYDRAQVFEAVLGVAMKTLTNYSNHLAGAVPNAEFVTMAEGRQVA